LLPGLFITGIGTGTVNSALGRIAVESVPPGRGGMGSGANNTARYLGGAAGATLAVSITTAGGAHELFSGWNTAALVAAGLCALGIASVASCRQWRRDPRPDLAASTAPASPRLAVPSPDATKRRLNGRPPLPRTQHARVHYSTHSPPARRHSRAATSAGSSRRVDSDPLAWPMSRDTQTQTCRTSVLSCDP
jgi:MFS family permease